MLNSNESIKVASLQKLANQSMLNGALVIEMVNNFFSESMEKNRDMGSEKYILLDFAKYLSFSEVQKNSKVVNAYIRFQEEGSLFQICYKKPLLEQVSGK